MTYQQTVDFLYSRLPMFSKTGAGAYKEDLHNTKRLLEKVGQPHLHFKTIHIAGTNGKGSVSHMLAAILQTAGYKTGLYTSPHLKDMSERIRINGQPIPEKNVIDFTEKIIPAIDEIEPSFFELTVAMAFDHFRNEKVDVAIIETGLGGRLDSTNVILPQLSVITNIGMDHMNILGDTPEKIAFEKAGIIKQNVPVVIGEFQENIADIFIQTAAAKKSTLEFASKNRTATEWTWKDHLLEVQIAEPGKTDHLHLQLDLAGIYQLKNILTVLEAVSQLRLTGYNIPEEDVKTALRKVKKLTGLHGRWEIIHEEPDVILDVAHNPDGFRQLLLQLEVTNFHQLHFVLGMVKDKDVDSLISLLPAHARYYFTKAQIPRALDEEILKTKAAEAGLKGESFPDVNTALRTAIQQAHKDDLVLVCGSVFLVGEVGLTA